MPTIVLETLNMEKMNALEVELKGLLAKEKDFNRKMYLQWLQSEVALLQEAKVLQEAKEGANTGDKVTYPSRSFEAYLKSTPHRPIDMLLRYVVGGVIGGAVVGWLMAAIMAAITGGASFIAGISIMVLAISILGGALILCTLICSAIGYALEKRLDNKMAALETGLQQGRIHPKGGLVLKEYDAWFTSVDQKPSEPSNTAMRSPGQHANPLGRNAAEPAIQDPEHSVRRKLL